MGELLAATSHFLNNLNVRNQIYLTDVLDILIIATLIYVAIYFLKKIRSLLAFIGVGVLAIVYVLAQFFNLYLTSIILQSVFGLFVIIIVVVFQDEIRRFFEFIATAGRRQVKTTPASSSTVTEIVQAVSQLANKKIGALIVLPGHESITRYTEGGNLLDGVVTQPLLESVFDPSSNGHDGAVVINKDRIVRFGAHLPLSKNFRQLKTKGTRHSAALGISEKSDALTIVVSEERGTISVAQNGKIKELKDSAELEVRLNKFLKDKFEESSDNFLISFFKSNILSKSAALGIAAILWFFSVYQAETIQRTVTMPITFRNVPEELLIQETLPREVEVTLSGRGESSFNRIEADNMRVVVDGQILEPGENIVRIEEDFIDRPFYISVVDIQPEAISVIAQEFEKQVVQAEVETTGELPDGLELESIRVSPESVNLLIPITIAAPSVIRTEPVDLSEIDGNKTINTRFNLPQGIRFSERDDNSATVIVRVSEIEDD